MSVSQTNYTTLSGTPAIDARRFGSTATAIQTAATLASATGVGDVLVAAGTWSCGTTTITVPANVRIIGAGYATNLQVQAGRTTPLFDVDGVSNITIANFRVTKASGSAAGGDSIAVYIRGTCEDVLVENVSVDAMSRGVYVAGGEGTVAGTCSGITLRRVKATNSPNNWGICFDDCDDVLVERCESNGHYFDGFKLRKNVKRLTLRKCKAHENGTSYPSGNGDGVDCYAGAGSGVVIEDFDAADNNGYGILVKTGPLNRDDAANYGVIRGIDVVRPQCRENLLSGIAFSINVDGVEDFTLPVPGPFTITGGNSDENGENGVSLNARGVTVKGLKCRRNTNNGITVGTRCMDVSIDATCLANGDGVTGSGVSILGGKRIRITGGTYLGKDGDQITADSDYAGLTAMSAYNIYVADGGADDVVIDLNNCTEGYALNSPGVRVDATSGTILVHGKNAGFPTTTGQYGSVGSTYTRTDPVGRYDVLWVKASTNPNQATSGWVRVLPYTTTTTIDLAEIAAGAILEHAVSLSGSGLITGDDAEATPTTAIEAGLIWWFRVSGTEAGTLYVYNTTGSPINPASASWRISGRRL